MAYFFPKKLKAKKKRVHSLLPGNFNQTPMTIKMKKCVKYNNKIAFFPWSVICH